MDDTEREKGKTVRHARNAPYPPSVVESLHEDYGRLAAELVRERVRASQLAQRIDILEGQNMRLRKSVSLIKQERMAVDDEDLEAIERQVIRDGDNMHVYLLAALRSRSGRASQLTDALPDPDKLDFIAEHLDITDGLWVQVADQLPGDHNEARAVFNGKEMQADLREWASKIRVLAAGVVSSTQPEPGVYEQVGFIHDDGEMVNLTHLTVRDMRESPLRTANASWSPLFRLRESVSSRAPETP